MGQALLQNQQQRLEIFSYLISVPSWAIGATPHITCVDIVTIFPVDGRLIFSLFVDWDGGGCIWGAAYDFLSTGICQLGSSLLRFVDWARYHPVEKKIPRLAELGANQIRNKIIGISYLSRFDCMLHSCSDAST